MNAPGKRFYLDGDDSWALVMDVRNGCVASFAPPYRERAYHMVDELNVRELAQQLRPQDTRANPATTPNTASGLLQPMISRTQQDKINEAVGRWDEVVSAATGPLLPTELWQAAVHKPRPELFDQPEPGGSLPPAKLPDDAVRVNLGGGGRVHDFRWEGSLTDAQEPSRVRCIPCGWSREAESYTAATNAFRQHVESTAEIDARLNLPSEHQFEHGSDARVHCKPCGWSAPAGTDEVARDLFDLHMAACAELRTGLTAAEQRATQVRPPIARNRSCTHGDEERCICPKWIPTPGGGA